MKTTVYLIRHGDVVCPKDTHGRPVIYGPDVPLSEEGKIKIRSLAGRFQGEGRALEKIYTSPFARALETAQIFTRAYRLPEPIVVPEFRDIDNILTQGLPLEDLLNGTLRSKPAPLGFKVETHEDVLKRMLEGLNDIVKKEPGRNLGVISHGDNIRVLLFHLLNPERPLPPIRELSTSDYLEKGEAWRLVLAPTLHVVEREYIGRPLEQFGRGERKS